MLRILLIIAVALAVIIGLMRLTGKRSEDTAPAAVSSEEVIEDVAAPTEMAVDEAAAGVDESADALGDAAEAAGETVEDVLDAPAAATEAAPDAAATEATPPEATPNN